MTNAQTNLVFRILQISTVAVFAGRAYQHLFWDAPYREIFWDPFYTQWFIEQWTSMSWEEYVTHPLGDIWFQRFTHFQGVFYLLCAVVAVFINKLPSWCRWILVLGAIDLVFLALIYMKDKFYHFGQFFEYSLQFGSPLFLFYFIRKKQAGKGFIFMLKLAIALTFICHGLYAVGYYPRPVTFMTMTHNILGFDAEGIVLFLNTMGVLDFVFAIGLFIPLRKAVFVSLIYIVIWGALTSLARIVGNFYLDFPLESLHQWVFAAVYRFPHFLVPMALLVLLNMLRKWQLLKRNKTELAL